MTLNTQARYELRSGDLWVNGEPVHADPRVVRIALWAHRFAGGEDPGSHGGVTPELAHRILRMEQERSLYSLRRALEDPRD
jgi:hypothetical protein